MGRDTGWRAAYDQAQREIDFHEQKRREHEEAKQAKAELLARLQATMLGPRLRVSIKFRFAGVIQSVSGRMWSSVRILTLTGCFGDTVRTK